MKALAPALLLLLALPAEAVSGRAPVRSIEAQEQAAWKLACQLKAFNCTQIAQPAVLYMVMQNTHGLYRHGAASIEVNVELQGTVFAGMVIVHELVHYLQHLEGAHEFGTGSYRNSCQRESEAFNITYAAAAWIGIEDQRLAMWPEISGQYHCNSVVCIRPREYQ